MYPQAISSVVEMKDTCVDCGSKEGINNMRDRMYVFHDIQIDEILKECGASSDTINKFKEFVYENNSMACGVMEQQAWLNKRKDKIVDYKKKYEEEKEKEEKENYELYQEYKEKYEIEKEKNLRRTDHFECKRK